MWLTGIALVAAGILFGVVAYVTGPNEWGLAIIGGASPAFIGGLCILWSFALRRDEDVGSRRGGMLKR
jgi:hypothetical protein